MTAPLRIWICTAHNPAFRCGGWASLRADANQVTGAAGGERNTTAQRMALAGLVSALRGLPPGADQLIHIQTTNPEAALLAEILAGRAQPEDDLDLWAQVTIASRGYRLEIVRVPAKPDTPTAFADAWANLAMDKAKATGPFTAAIPKANLAKAPGLTA
jgi:ribonuclease HI